MDEEHEASFAEFFGDGQAFGRSPAGLVEGFFEIDLGTGTGKAGDAAIYCFIVAADQLPVNFGMVVSPVALRPSVDTQTMPSAISAAPGAVAQ